MKITIITPSFNQGAFIQRTLQSATDQRLTLPISVDLEHLIYDGGSTDQTLTILKKFPYPIRYISERDQGQAHAVNKGIQNSQSDLIGRLNSDDIYYPQALSKVIACFEQHPNIDIIYGEGEHIDCEDHPFERYPTEPWDFERLQETCFICQPTVFFRRSIFEKYGLLDENLRYCMDYEYWLRLGLQHVKFHYLGEKLAGSRLYADNKTLGARAAVHKEINTMFKQKFGQVPDRWIYNYAHAKIDQKIKRDQSPLWYHLQLIFFSLYASWLWNKKPLPHHKKPLLQWTKQAFKGIRS